MRVSQMKTLNIFIYSLSHFLRFSFDSPSYYGECYASFFFFSGFKGNYCHGAEAAFRVLGCRAGEILSLSLACFSPCHR